ncbi:hypothetical protein RR48_03614 [Papilio machaon]|uniref:Uncharacterized protein n=1 Tax=Papilio machaon TaxID=76193 RepID=A0A0N0PAZ4_PAPMA|nr:hypothetical protein RR48_03614 [Papilio machaon]
MARKRSAWAITNDGKQETSSGVKEDMEADKGQKTKTLILARDYTKTARRAAIRRQLFVGGFTYYKSENLVGGMSAA